MKLGTPRVIRLRILLPLVTLLVTAGSGVAQQSQSAHPTPSQSTAPQNSASPTQVVPEAGLTPGQAASGTQPSTVKADDKNAGGGPADVVRLGPGDLVELSVYNVPELSTKARVSNSGDLYLPLIDYVHVGGLTQEEAQTVIEKRLEDGGFVRSPHVSIFVDEATSQGVTILGEVGRPGIYPALPSHKLYDVISEAGGFSSSSSRKIAIIHRNQPEAVHIELPRNLADDLSGNVDVEPGDTITVPRAPIIYVVGDVGRPSGLLVDNGTLTVLQAIALAGGINRTAKTGGSRIIRKGPNGMTETTVQLKKMLEAKAPDVTLQADDILFVPVSGAKVAAGRTADAAFALATAVSIYAVHP